MSKYGTITTTIAQDAALTGAIDLFAEAGSGAALRQGSHLALIAMPSAWTTANMTLQVSADGTTFNNLYDRYGTEYSIIAAASRAIIIDLADLAGARYIKIRSGTAASAVNQAAERTLTLILRSV